jgi:hypothetical protein
MMTVAEVSYWIGMIVVGVALLAVVAVIYLAMMRWLIVILPAIVLVGFAFAPEMELRFTAALLGVLAILYLPPLAVAWVWRQIASHRPVAFARAGPPSALELAHQMFAEEEVRDRADRQVKAAREARDQDDRDDHARDLEQQGMVSLWSRQ